MQSAENSGFGLDPSVEKDNFGPGEENQNLLSDSVYVSRYFGLLVKRPSTNAEHFLYNLVDLLLLDGSECQIVLTELL